MVVKLFIKDSGGEITEIELCDSEFESYTVLQLRTKIREKTTRGEEALWLIFKSWLLEDAAKLSDCGIQHESTIQIWNRRITKQLFIKDLVGKPHTFCLDEDEFKSCLVKHLKSKIHDKTGLPADKQRLIYAAKQLEDGRTLFAYGIQNMSTIHLVESLRGGGTGGRTDPEKEAGSGMGDKGGKNRSMETVFNF